MLQATAIPRRYCSRLEFRDECVRLFGDLEHKFVDSERTRASIASQETGDCRVVNIITDPHFVEAGGYAVRNPQFDMVKLVIQAGGQASFCQDGRSTILEDGEWVLYDPRRPYSVRGHSALSHWILQVQRDVIGERRLSVLRSRYFTNRDLSGVPRIMGDALAGAVQEWETTNSDKRHLLSDTLAGILNSILDLNIEDNGFTERYHEISRDRIKRLVEKQLADPSLNIDTIAASLNCSKRYLHRVFETEDTTLERFIWDARLRKARAQLSAYNSAQRTVSEIAFACGFSSSSHFSRAFKARFGVTPSEFRNARGDF